MLQRFYIPVYTCHCDAVLPLLFCAALQLSEAVRDAKLALLKELKPDQPDEAAAAEDIIAELLAEAPTHLPLLLEIVKRWDVGQYAVWFEVLHTCRLCVWNESCWPRRLHTCRCC
jgi:hypothetical protein